MSSNTTLTAPPTDTPPLETLVDQLVQAKGPSPQDDLIRAIIHTALGLANNGLQRGDAKILATTVREMAASFRVFAPYKLKRKVTFFGSAREPEGSPRYELTRQVAAWCTSKGYMVITGGGEGVMRAGNEGAGVENSFGVTIQLPFEVGGNSIIRNDHKNSDHKYFFTRKLTFVKETDGLIFMPGGFGTLDECFEILTLMQTGKTSLMPFVMVDIPGGHYWQGWKRFVEEELLGHGYISKDDFSLFKITSDPEAAAREIETFYRVFHSLRFAGPLTVMRLNRALPEAFLAELEGRYGDILTSPGLKLSGPLPVEVDAPHLSALPRLILNFNRRDYGRLRQFIDELNRQVDEPIPAPARAAWNGDA